MAKLRIDEGFLLMAFDSGDGTEQWFLDRQSGEVIRLSDDLGFLDDDDEDDEGDDDLADWEKEERALRRKIYADENDEQYLQIPSLGSHEGYRIMEDFAVDQEDERVREKLFRALDGRRPFRSFKDALPGNLLNTWYAYHEQRLRREALDWLEAEGIDAELTSPAAQPE
jgi:hypothetical protein